MNSKNLLIKLINIKSISGDEKEIGDYLYKLLSRQGFEVNKNNVDDKRFNVIAKVGEPKLFFQAHMDTVPPFIKASEKEGKIYGRGSCDTKASIACMIRAAIAAKKLGLNNFGLAFTVSEEVDFSGVKLLAKVIDFSDKYVIVGEPTNLRTINSIYGILVIAVKTKGKAAHSSQPQLGVNAIDKLMKLVSDLKKIEIYPKSNCSLVKLNGGIADNIIPAEAKAIFSLRINPDDKNDYLTEFKKVTGDRAKVKKELYVAPTKSEILSSLNFLGEGREVKGCTELNFLENGLVLGPGDMNMAHREDECVEIEQLFQAEEIYLKIIQKLNEKYRS